MSLESKPSDMKVPATSSNNDGTWYSNKEEGAREACGYSYRYDERGQVESSISSSFEMVDDRNDGDGGAYRCGVVLFRK